MSNLVFEYVLSCHRHITLNLNANNSLQVSANGFVSLGRRYTPLLPNMGSGYDVLAPFWTNLDFTYPSSGAVAYSQHINTVIDPFSQTIIEKTGSYISARANINFSPNLVILVTWIKAFPYPASTYRNTNKTATFQLNLATNGHSTYASYIYDDGGMLWKDVGRTPHVGYSINGQILDMTLGQTGLYPYYRFDAVVGNTGRKGEWMWDVINFPLKILSPKHLILTYGEVNNFEIKATSPNASTLTYSIHGNGISANVNSTTGKVSMYVNSRYVAIKLIVKNEQNRTREFQPKITLCYCLNGASCNSWMENPDATSPNRLLTYAKCNCKLGYTGAFCKQQGMCKKRKRSSVTNDANKTLTKGWRANYWNNKNRWQKGIKVKKECEHHASRQRVSQHTTGRTPLVSKPTRDSNRGKHASENMASSSTKAGLKV
eukprot:gene17967-19763_t